MNRNIIEEICYELKNAICHLNIDFFKITKSCDGKIQIDFGIDYKHFKLVLENGDSDE